MLRKLSLSLAAVAALAVAVPAHAAPAYTSDSERPKLGVGVGIYPFGTEILGAPVDIYVPIMLAPQFRLEPFVGFLTSSNDARDQSDLTIGAGFFFVQRIAQPADMYLGGRVMLNFASTKPNGGSSSSGTDFAIAAAAGAEYYLVPKFSIGLEAQLGFYSQSKESNAQGLGTTGFFTNGVGFLRFYF